MLKYINPFADGLIKNSPLGGLTVQVLIQKEATEAQLIVMSYVMLSGGLPGQENVFNHMPITGKVARCYHLFSDVAQVRTRKALDFLEAQKDIIGTLPLSVVHEFAKAWKARERARCYAQYQTLLKLATFKSGASNEEACCCLQEASIKDAVQAQLRKADKRFCNEVNFIASALDRHDYDSVYFVDGYAFQQALRAS